MASLSQHQNHFIRISFPAQGHINPTLQFAKRLIRTDGYDDGFKPGLDDIDHFMSEIAWGGSQALRKLIQSLHANGGSGSVTCVIYAIIVPWVAEVTRDLQIPSVLLWIQSAMTLSLTIIMILHTPIHLPNLPLLTCKDFPTFFLPTNLHTFGLPLFGKQFEVFEGESKPIKVLVNIFDELESDALRAVDVNKINLIGIGPLIPSAFLDDEEPSDKSFGGDLVSVTTADENKDRLHSKKEGSEIFCGLTECGFPFLWVCPELERKEANKEKNVFFV
ncbi:hypothetical protein MKW98_028302 [Papaver atlanticum]|uniref:Uncharacterized protein n=1 Tax=Papaver atlanticum TaxID=357466 RepID=A0AAD4SY32_9MAGN|nr:hypothetical protein MKW98_028302 [Papaver atlanticum]